MNKQQITDMLTTRLKEILSELMRGNPIEMPDLNESTRLIGKKAVLDSLGLVNLIISIEQQLGDDHDITITIADERAMSQEKSPFRTIGSLSEYICLLIEEQSQPISSAANPV
jgi:acyl carrier protein